MKNKHTYKFGFCNKIKKSSSIYSLYKTGIEWKCPCLKIYYNPNKQKSSRMGINISKESGNSFFRNKIKRAAREIFRTKISKIGPPYDVLIKICSKKDFLKKKQIEEALLTWCNSIKK